MAEILQFARDDEDESMDVSVEGYLEMYDGYASSIEAAKELFQTMHSVFCDICAEIDVDQSKLHLDNATADHLFAQTLQWMFPLPFEDNDDQDYYELIWKGSDGGYKYKIHVVLPVEGNDDVSADYTAVMTRVSRTDESGYTLYWNPETEIWEEIEEEDN